MLVVPIYLRVLHHPGTHVASSIRRRNVDICPYIQGSLAPSCCGGVGAWYLNLYLVLTPSTIISYRTFGSATPISQDRSRRQRRSPLSSVPRRRRKLEPESVLLRESESIYRAIVSPCRRKSRGRVVNKIVSVVKPSS